ncbi:hypothetical protein ACTXT7_006359 [Hymenolepis weldensis]
MYKVEKLIGRDSYSLVYKARYKDPDQKERTCIYKRTFFFNSEAVRCALRESHILRRMAENNLDCPVLPNLLRIYQIDQSSIIFDNWPKLKKFGGDLYYMAPEIANEIEITPKSDIWQLGILAATLVSGNIRPTNDKSILLEMAKEGFRQIKNFKLLPRAFRSFINACLTKDYKKRPEASQVIHSSFMEIFNKRKGAIELPSPLGASEIVGISLNYLDPCRKDILNAALDRDFPNITYSLQTENGEIKQRILPYVKQNLADLENGNFTRETLESLSDNFKFPSDSHAEDYECEDLGPGTIIPSNKVTATCDGQSHQFKSFCFPRIKLSPAGGSII